MRPLVFALLLGLTPSGAATKVIAIWLDRGSPYMELRPDGSGRIGAIENNWSAEKGQLHIVQKESGDAFDIPYTIENGGKTLKIMVQGLPVELERSKQKPAAKAPPPPKTPSQLADTADAGTKDKK